MANTKKSLTDRRTRRLSIPITPEEHRAIGQRADAARRSVSDYVRLVAIGKLPEQR